MVALGLCAAFALLTVAVVPNAERTPSRRPVADSYYMVIYSAEKANTPTRSHCFATFARVSQPGGSSDQPKVELHHINWFSVRGHRCGATFGLVEGNGRPTRAEPGANLTTRDALELVLDGNHRVSRWGPYEIDRGLYERALRQIDLLEGRVPGRTILYKAIDLGYREGAEILALNCIHAVSDIVRKPTPLRTWMTYGDEAARRVVCHLRPWIKAPVRDRAEVWPAIWSAIWGGAPTRDDRAIARAELEPASHADPQFAGTHVADVDPGAGASRVAADASGG